MVKCYAMGCTTSSRDRAGVLFRFPTDVEQYVRDLSAQLLARKIGGPCSIEDARTLYVKYVCKYQDHKEDPSTDGRITSNRTSAK